MPDQAQQKTQYQFLSILYAYFEVTRIRMIHREIYTLWQPFLKKYNYAWGSYFSNFRKRVAQMKLGGEWTRIFLSTLWCLVYWPKHSMLNWIFETESSMRKTWNISVAYSGQLGTSIPAWATKKYFRLSFFCCISMISQCI